MEKIEPGKYVELGYDLYQINADGTKTLVHQTDENDPEKLVFHMNNEERAENGDTDTGNTDKET